MEGTVEEEIARPKGWVMVYVEITDSLIDDLSTPHAIPDAPPPVTQATLLAHETPAADDPPPDTIVSPDHDVEVYAESSRELDVPTNRPFSGRYPTPSMVRKCLDLSLLQ